MPYSDPEKKKAYMREYNKRWYAENKESKDLVGKSVANKRNLRINKKTWILNRLGGACERCGEDDPILLDVHHTDPSYKQSRHKSITDYAWDDLLAKAHTLELLCVSCHRKHHAEERTQGWGYESPVLYHQLV